VGCHFLAGRFSHGGKNCSEPDLITNQFDPATILHPALQNLIHHFRHFRKPIRLDDFFSPKEDVVGKLFKIVVVKIGNGNTVGVQTVEGVPLRVARGVLLGIGKFCCGCGIFQSVVKAPVLVRLPDCRC